MAGQELPLGILGRGHNSPYRAGSRSGDFANWLPSHAGPVSVVEHDSDLIAARARDSYRNSGFIKKAIHTLVTSEVGDGIKTHSTATNQRYRREIQKLWDEWVFGCDADGVLTYDGIVQQAVTQRYMVGGQFIRMIPINSQDRLPVPLILQAMEIDQVPINMSEHIRTRRGRVVQGIEFSNAGRKTAVHAFKTHPQDHLNLSNVQDDIRTVRIPIADIIHHYEPIRPGQVREIPWTVEALEVAKRIDRYTHSELIRKHIRSHITGFITRENFNEDDMLFDPFTGEALDSGFVPGNIKLNPGMLGTLNPGEDIKLLDADNQPDGYTEYMRFHVQQMASAVYVPYELISSDYSQINDRLVRSVLDDFRRFVNARQNIVTIPQICRTIWGKFNDIAVMSGVINAPDYFENRSDFVAAEYITQKNMFIHPVQDREGIKLDLEMGLSTREIELKNLRRNPDNINDQLDKESEIIADRTSMSEAILREGEQEDNNDEI